MITETIFFTFLTVVLTWVYLRYRRPQGFPPGTNIKFDHFF